MEFCYCLILSPPNLYPVMLDSFSSCDGWPLNPLDMESSCLWRCFSSLGHQTCQELPHCIEQTPLDFWSFFTEYEVSKDLLFPAVNKVQQIFRKTNFLIGRLFDNSSFMTYHQVCSQSNTTHDSCHQWIRNCLTFWST